MTTDLALALIQRTMYAQGHNNDYTLTFRDLVIPPHTILKEDAKHAQYYLVDGYSLELQISSDEGIYDELEQGINERQHIHTGMISIENRSSILRSVAFVVATPLHID